MKRDIFLLRSKDDSFFPVIEIVKDLLRHWNDEEGESIFDPENEEDQRFAARRLAHSMECDAMIVTEDLQKLVEAGKKARRAWDIRLIRALGQKELYLEDVKDYTT